MSSFSILIFLDLKFCTAEEKNWTKSYTNRAGGVYIYIYIYIYGYDNLPNGFLGYG